VPLFYKGVASGTHWHRNDPVKSGGFTAQSPMLPDTLDRLMNHIAKAQTGPSPYVSLTLSYSVAWTYASFGSSPRNPGTIFEIELNDPLPPGLKLIDPVKRVAELAPEPLISPCYQHDGYPDVLLALVAPAGRKRILQRSIAQPPGNPSRPANISRHLETLVRSLRDAEVLAFGSIPAGCIATRYPAI
jgi:hypothetical protein